MKLKDPNLSGRAVENATNNRKVDYPDVEPSNREDN
jgi:hypothetical protein